MERWSLWQLQSSRTQFDIAPEILIQTLLIFLKTHYENILSYAKQEKQTRLEIMLEEARWTLRSTGNREDPRSPFCSSL